MTPPAPLVRYEVQDRIARILMDHAPVNAMTVPLLDAVLAAFERASADDEVDVIVLGSAVPGRFSAGLDLKAFAQGDWENSRALLERLYTRFTDLQFRLGKPSIAAVNGTARGGGMTLAISCDMMVVERGATLGYPEIDVGVIPAIHFTHLPRIVGRHRAFDLLFTGRTFSPEEGHELGIVTRVVDTGNSLSAALELARVLADKPQRVLRMAREMFMREIDSDYRKGVAAAVENFCNVAQTRESREGIEAFVARQAERAASRGKS
ncbi:MAG: enoyl-CoA hydratase/isomerase family protein [Burkholderiales bacterium]|jgi:enoyl-CoA hydratase